MEWSIDVVGWCGALVVLLAYALVSIRRVEGDSVLFQVLNISGAALLLANTFYWGAYPSAFVNTIWIGIGGYALYRRQRNLRTTTSNVKSNIALVEYSDMTF